MKFLNSRVQESKVSCRAEVKLRANLMAVKRKKKLLRLTATLKGVFKYKKGTELLSESCCSLLVLEWG